MSNRKRKFETPSNNEPEKKKSYMDKYSLKEPIVALKRYDAIASTSKDSDILNYYSNKEINDLPTEMLQKIFSYLSYYERKHISLVCRKWHLLCLDPVLNQQYTVGPTVKLVQIRKMLNEAPYLKQFRIIMRNDLKTILSMLSKCNKEITMVKIEKCLDCKLSTFIQLSKRCPNLKSLSISNTVISFTRTFTYKGELFNNLQSFQAVNSCVHRSANPVNFSITTTLLLKLLQRCKKLKYIKFSLSEIQPDLLDDEFVSHLCDIMNYKLVGLSLDATNLTDKSVENIAMCKKLKVLKLTCATKLSIRAINKLKSFSNLQTLYLTQVAKIGKSTWKSLFNQTWMKYLLHLNLTECKRINDEVLQVIGKNCISLVYLRLYKCKLINSDGLATVITGCKNLTYLNVKCTRKTISRSFNLIPTYLKNLKTLSCEKKYVQKSVLNNLTTLCPNLIIL